MLGTGLDAPNSAVVKGKLYVLGGWKGSVGGMAAWGKLSNLGYPVPITLVGRPTSPGIWVAFFSRCQRYLCGQGTNGAQLLRACWSYDPVSDSWERLPDAPHHIEQGGTAVLKERWILSLGSTHGRDSCKIATLSRFACCPSR